MLEMSGINKSFYGIQVLKDAEVHVKPGEVHVLLGENGAGKSTLIKVLSCAYRRESGKIIFDGKELEAATPKEAMDKGISVIYQEFNLNPHVPIYENIMLGKEFSKGGVINTKKCIKEAQKYLDMIGLKEDPRTLVGDLSIAQKQMVEIAKAISTNVKLLVLDEPTAAITDKETEMLFEIGERCTVMCDGEYVTTVELGNSSVEELTKLMVGRDVSFARIENPYVEEDKNILEVKNVSYKNVVKNISLTLKKGEILGMAGLVGAGRTELAKCIIGAFQKSSGSCYLNGKKLKDKDIKSTIDAGIVYLSEDRKDEGLILMHSLTDNVALPNLNQFGKFVLDNKKIFNTAKEFTDKTNVKTAAQTIPAECLSGGNQQKVVIAKWLLSDAKVYIFDEPTRDIDVGARDEIYHLMTELVKNGASILMISSDLVEIQKMCNRVIVLKDGEVTADLKNNDKLTQDEILSYALTGGKKGE